VLPRIQRYYRAENSGALHDCTTPLASRAKRGGQVVRRSGAAGRARGGGWTTIWFHLVSSAADPHAIASPSTSSITSRIALLVPATGVMNVSGTVSRAKKGTYMKTFTIDAGNNISAFASPEEAAATTATPFDTFARSRP
jgi:hypothetical protein